MADEAVMLAVGYDPDKVSFPVEVSIKLDGAAAKFTMTKNGWVVCSRQNEPLPSCAHLLRALNAIPKSRWGAWDDLNIVAELAVLGEPVFKNASGIIRRKEEDTRIVAYVYDAFLSRAENADDQYADRVVRIEHVLKIIGDYGELLEDGVCQRLFSRVPVVKVARNRDELNDVLSGMHDMMKCNKMYEGYMVRPLYGDSTRYRMGKRSTNMMRYKPKPTLDLRVVSFEEAVDKHGNPKGMVGRINCAYKDGQVGVGPGCLTHAERKSLWAGYNKTYLSRGLTEIPAEFPLIAEVEYMQDDEYTALRQAVFKRWRPDKRTPNEAT